MKLCYLFLASALFASPSLAQNAPSGSPRVQGVPDGFGDPVQVTIVSANGSDTSAGTVTVVGNVAHDAADSGNPVKIGVRATDNPTAVTVASNDRSDALANPNGAIYIAAPSGGADAGSDGRAVLNSFGNRTGASATNTPTYVGLGGFNGTSWDRVRSDANGLVVQPALSATFWNFPAAAAGTITNTTTAVTIKAAAGAGVRNYICTIQISNDTLSAVTNLQVRDGAGGAILWLGRLQVTQTSSHSNGSIILEPCIKGTANTLLEVVTPTAVTGSIYFSAQGYTGI